MRKLSQSGESVTYSVRLPQELKDKITDAAKEFGLSPAEYIRLILSLAVNGRLDIAMTVSEDKS